MFEKVLLSEDIDTISQGVMTIMNTLHIDNVDQVQYCDDAYLKITRAKKDGQMYDLLITDLSFKSDHRKQKIESGEALIKILREEFPDLKIIVYSIEDRIEKVRSLINDCKINAYVTKGRRGLLELEEALTEVNNGNTYISRELAHNLQAKRPVEILDIDIDLLNLLAEGYSQEQISKELKKKKISPNSLSSIEKRLNILRGHFGANNAIHLVAISKDLGLI